MPALAASHLPLRVRRWIDFIRHSCGDPAHWQGVADRG